MSPGNRSVRPNVPVGASKGRVAPTGDGPPIMFGGGAGLFATGTEAGLIDDYKLLIAPMALGDGKRLFAELEEPLKLRLTNAHTFPSGAVLLEYVRRDAPAT